jgi:hypothetical protein
MSDTTFQYCPHFRSRDPVPIVYGYPRHEMLEASQASCIELGDRARPIHRAATLPLYVGFSRPLQLPA